MMKLLTNILQKHRKSVSPIIATMLMIALVVAAVATAAVLINFYINSGNNYDVTLIENAFYDFDGDGMADFAVFDMKTTTIETVPIENPVVVFSNRAFLGDSWEVSELTSDSISVAEPGYLAIYAGLESEEFSVGDQYTLAFVMEGAVVEVSGTVSEIKPTDPLTFQLEEETTLSSSDVALKLHEAMARNEEDAFTVMAGGSGSALAGIKIVLFSAKTDLPVAPEKLSDESGRASFRVKAGQYYAKIYFDGKEKVTATFNHPAKLDNFNLLKKIRLQRAIEAVNVHYSENDVPVQGATIMANKKVVVNGKIVEQVTPFSKTTDANGTSTFFVPTGEYKFLAYHGSSIPATSSFVDVSQTKDVYINTEPGIVYVKVLTAGGTPIANARVQKYAVSGGSSTSLGTGYTNSSGIIKMTIPASNFFVEVRFGQLYKSNVFKVVPNTVYEFYLGGNSLTVNLTTESGAPIENSYIYLYDGAGRSLSAQRTNSTGFASFYGLKNGTYYLKYYTGTGYINTDPFVVNSDYLYNLTVSGAVLYFNVTDTNGNARASQYVYLYNSQTGQYLGYGRTNSSGIATLFTTQPEGTPVYGYTYFYDAGVWTTARTLDFNLTSGMIVPFVLGGIKVEVHVQDDSGTSITSQYVNAYLDGKFYARQWLNSNGNATFSLPAGLNFTIGIDYGTIVQTSPFNTSVTQSVLLVVQLVDFTVQVKDANGNNLSNAYVYLYAATKQWNYLGRERTNSQGQVGFRAVETGMYRVYVYSWNPYTYFYSSNFTISDGATIVIQPSPVTIRLQTMSGEVLENAYFNLYTAQGLYAGWGRTNSTGYAVTNAIDGAKYYIYSSYVTSPVVTLNESSVNVISVDAVTIYAKVVDAKGNPYVPPSSYYSVQAIHPSNGSYGGWGYINSSGVATLLVSNSAEFKLRTYLNGREILSNTFNASEGHIETLIVDGYDLSVKVTRDGNPISNGYVYLYDAELNRYIGWSRTNSSGYADFSFIVNGTYYIRVYANPTYQKSGTFNVTGDTVFDYSLVTTSVAVEVYQPDSTNRVGSGQYVYLRTADGGWSGYARTNSSGIAVFSAVVNTTYFAYSYYSSVSSYIYSGKFNATVGATVSINPVRMYAQVIDGANQTVSGMRVFLSLEGIQAGYATTNSSGIATIYGNNQSQYILVAGKGYSMNSGASFLGDGIITATSGAIHTINIGGGTVYVKVLDSNGQPVQNSYVYLYIPTGVDMYIWTGYYAQTNSSGVATFLGVGNGTYVAYSSALALYSSQFDAANGLIITIDASGNSLMFNPQLPSKKE